jgi:hypothetical protein
MEESFGLRYKQPGWSPINELKIRATWDQITDMHAAHLQLGDFYWEKTDYSPVWKIITKLTRGILHQASDWDDNDRMHDYIVTQLGHSNGETLLGETFPFPSKRRYTWHYPEVFSTREAYENWVWPIRRVLWSRLIETTKPNRVLCYGKGTKQTHWKKLREVFSGCAWQAILGGKGSAARYSPDTQVFLLPFFGYKQYQLEDLQEIIRYATGSPAS